MFSFLLILTFYLIGSFPSGHLIAKLNRVDLASQGSGSIGATNVSRVIGKKAGLLTVVLDISKGMLPLAVVSWLGFTLTNLACLGLFLVLGHCISIPGLLRGGKGIATSIGVILVLSPLLAILLITTFSIVFYFGRFVSLASITAAILSPIYSMIFLPASYEQAVPWLVAISVIVIIRHHQNIQRLVLGQEPRFAFKKADV